MSLVPELDLVVGGVREEAPGVRELTLVAPDGRHLPSFTPGSHLVLTVPAGEARPRDLANAYSLTGESVRPRHYTVAVLLCAPADGGAGGSVWVHGLEVGDRVTARGPRSAFAPVQLARKHLLVGAGIGVTPLLSHLRSAVRWRRAVEVVHVHRPGHGAYVDELRDLAGDRLSVAHDRATAGALLAERLADQPLGTHLYVCGPTGFIEAVTASAAALGWPASRVHVEHFGVEALDPGDPFTVQVADGPLLDVASGTSLLDALVDAGYDVPHLCRQGVCGECRVGVVAGAGGEPLHRDLYLTADERAAGDCLMACVSRALPDDSGRAHLEVSL